LNRIERIARPVSEQGTTLVVIIGLDPMIQNPLRLNSNRRRKLNEISVLLDCRAEPGNDSEGGARPGRA
jgi:hypothetical protein